MSNIKLPALDAAAVSKLAGKSLLTTEDFSTAELDTLLDVAKALETLDRAGIKNDFLTSELAYSLFFDQSTRTRSAWAGAATRLGMAPVIVDGKSTQVAHGETPSETGAMLGMNSHAMGIRHDLILGYGRRFIREIKEGIDAYLKATGDERQVPIVNLQCDFDHPTQSLADLMWLKEKYGSPIDGVASDPKPLKGKKIAVSWAYSPSYAKPLSVPQGLIMLMTRYGADVTLAHPEGYTLLDECMTAANTHSKESGGSFKVTHSMDEAFEGADIVYPKSWGPMGLMLERVASANDAKAMGEIEKRALASNAAHKDWICDERRMATTAGGNALYMHCLPADIGAEVTPGVMQKYVVDVAREANKKLYVIMALLAGSKVKDLAGKLEALAKKG